MDLGLVMEELKNKLTAALPNLNGFGYPVETAEPDAGIVGYPEKIDYTQSYQNGMHRFENLPLWLLVGQVDQQSTRDTLAAYVKGTGSSSVRAILETGPYTNFWTLKVLDCVPSTYVEAGVTYLAAAFHLDITGPGV